MNRHERRSAVWGVATDFWVVWRIVGRWLTYPKNTLKIGKGTGFGPLHSQIWGSPLLNFSLEGRVPFVPAFDAHERGVPVRRHLPPPSPGAPRAAASTARRAAGRLGGRRTCPVQRRQVRQTVGWIPDRHAIHWTWLAGRVASNCFSDGVGDPARPAPPPAAVHRSTLNLSDLRRNYHSCLSPNPPPPSDAGGRHMGHLCQSDPWLTPSRGLKAANTGAGPAFQSTRTGRGRFLVSGGEGSGPLSNVDDSRPAAGGVADEVNARHARHHRPATVERTPHNRDVAALLNRRDAPCRHGSMICVRPACHSCLYTGQVALWAEMAAGGCTPLIQSFKRTNFFLLF